MASCHLSIQATTPPKVGEWKRGDGRKTKYHCTFLAWNKETAWMEGNWVRKFKKTDGGDSRRKEYFVKQGDLKQSHAEAIKLAIAVLDDPGNPSAYLIKGKTLNKEEKKDTRIENVDTLKAGIENIENSKKQEEAKLGVSKVNMLASIGMDSSKMMIPSVPDPVPVVKPVQKVVGNDYDDVDVDRLCRETTTLPPRKAVEKMLSTPLPTVSSNL